MKKKIVALALVFCLSLAIGVGGTLAYLTATTDTVTNTFSVGNVKFDDNGLDEAKVNEYGQKLDATGKVYTGASGQTLADRVTENTYKLVPGHTYVKDPTVHIAANTEDCWVFVKVVNPIADLEKADVTGQTGTTIAAQMAAKGWVAVDATNAPGVYANTTKYTTQTTVQNIVVFESFTLADDANVGETETVNGKETPKYAGAQITVQAGLIQAEGFDSYTAAWTAAGDQLFTTTAPAGGETPAPVDPAE